MGIGWCFSRVDIDGGLSCIWNGCNREDGLLDEIIGTHDTSLGRLCKINDLLVSEGCRC